MIRSATGRRLRAALILTAIGGATPLSAADSLVVDGPGGATLGRLPFAQSDEICLEWLHSVTGGAVADCFENRNGTMVLTRSYLHDFAAGLGEVAGRGTLVSADRGGYWIIDMNEAIPGNALTLRVGAPRVGHVLRGSDQTLDLSARAAGARVTLRLADGQASDTDADADAAAPPACRPDAALPDSKLPDATLPSPSLPSPSPHSPSTERPCP